MNTQHAAKSTQHAAPLAQQAAVNTNSTAAQAPHSAVKAQHAGKSTQQPAVLTQQASVKAQGVAGGVKRSRALLETAEVWPGCSDEDDDSEGDCHYVRKPSGNTLAGQPLHDFDDGEDCEVDYWYISDEYEPPYDSEEEQSVSDDCPLENESGGDEEGDEGLDDTEDDLQSDEDDGMQPADQCEVRTHKLLAHSACVKAPLQMHRLTLSLIPVGAASSPRARKDVMTC